MLFKLLIDYTRGHRGPTGRVLNVANNRGFHTQEDVIYSPIYTQ